MIGYVRATVVSVQYTRLILAMQHPTVSVPVRAKADLSSF